MMRHAAFLVLVIACSKPAPPNASPPSAAPPAPVTPAAPPPSGPEAPPTAVPPPAEAAKDTEGGAPPVAKVETILVWRATEGGYETSWVEVGASEVHVAARRAEAVTFDGSTLWALQMRYKTVDTVPCDTGEAAPDAKVQPTGATTFPGLEARALGGTATQWLVTLPEGPIAGEVWGNDVLLAGGTGGRVLVYRQDSGYACGAHGYVEDDRFVWDLAAGGRVDTSPMAPALDGLREKAVEPISADSRKSDCLDADDPPHAASEIAFAGFALQRVNGAVVLDHHFVKAADADWNFVCTIEHVVPGPIAPATGLTAPDAAISRALAELDVSGIVGYARVTLSGAARDAGLAAFRDASTLAPPKPAAGDGVADLLARGRRATREKRLGEAIEAFSAAIARNPSLARAWSGRGYARLLKGEPDDARADLEKALSLDSGASFQAAVWFNLGILAEQRNDPAAAKAAFEKAHASKPSPATRKRLEATP